MSQLFIVPFRVSPTGSSILPAGVEGAYVSCYAAGDGYEDAVRRCLTALQRDGLHPDKIRQPIIAMDPSDWTKHAAEQWPDQAATLPDQPAFEARIAQGDTVYGPFGTF